MSDAQRQRDHIYPLGQLGPAFNPGSSFRNGNPYNQAPDYAPVPATANVNYYPPFAIPQPGMSMKSQTVATLPQSIIAMTPRTPADFLFPNREFVGYN